MNSHNVSLNLIYLTILILLVSGCMPLRPDTDPALDRKAFLLATRARSFNQQILSSKGTGWIWIETQSKKDKFRIAWAAVSPNKIRITFLISGHPIETIIATGEKITFFSHTGGHSKYSYHSKDPNMKDYIKIPVKMSEMISILLGRLPVKTFDDAWFSPLDSSLSTITLKQKQRGLTQYLFFNNDGKTERLRSTDNTGRLLYELAVTKYKSYDFGEIPVKIKIKDMDDRKLTLEITNFQPNPMIKESVFQLTESG